LQLLHDNDPNCILLMTGKMIKSSKNNGKDNKL